MKRGVVTDVRNLTSVMLPDSLGRECIKTTLYDLTVFNYREVDCGKAQTTVVIKDSMGRDHKTTLYNLEMLNKLGMCCFRGNKKAKEIRNKFNDVLVKHETGVTQPEMSDEEIMSRALEIAHRTLALREERIKALTAERDEAIRRFIGVLFRATMVNKNGSESKF